MASNSIVRATRSIVDIAGIPINGLMMPDSSYRLSNTDAGKAVGESPRSLGNFLNSKSFKALKGNGSVSGETVKSKVIGEKQTFNASPVELVAIYWASFGTSNQKAFALTVALATEAIDRRFDRAFGVKISEKERDASLALRFERLQARHDWTDVIRDRMIQLGYYHDRRRVNDEFKRLTVEVNLALFNQKHFQCDRDTMTAGQQQLIGDFERAAKRKTKQFPTATPAEIVRKALEVF